MLRIIFGTIDSRPVAPLTRGTATRQLCATVIARVGIWRQTQRERREIAALGAIGRLELQKLLIARGEAGLSTGVWSEARRAEDVLACGTSPQVTAMAAAHSAAVLRNFSR